MVNPWIRLEALYLFHRNNSIEDSRMRPQIGRRLNGIGDHGVCTIREDDGGELCLISKVFQCRRHVRKSRKGVVCSHQSANRPIIERETRVCQRMVQRVTGDVRKRLVLLLGLISGRLGRPGSLLDAGGRTHAVQAPCVLQLVPPPQRCEAGGLFLPEVGAEFFGDRLCGQQGAVEVKRNHELIRRSHCSSARGS